MLNSVKLSKDYLFRWLITDKQQRPQLTINVQYSQFSAIKKPYF